MEDHIYERQGVRVVSEKPREGWESLVSTSANKEWPSEHPSQAGESVTDRYENWLTNLCLWLQVPRSALGRVSSELKNPTLLREVLSVPEEWSSRTAPSNVGVGSVRCLNSVASPSLLVGSEDYAPFGKPLIGSHGQAMISLTPFRTPCRTPGKSFVRESGRLRNPGHQFRKGSQSTTEAGYRGGRRESRIASSRREERQSAAGSATQGRTLFFRCVIEC